MELVNSEIDTLWNESKEKNSEKVDRNVQKRIVKGNHQSGTVHGVLVGDRELKDLEKEILATEKNENSEEAIVYAGIEINKNEKDILCLPPDFTVFPKIDIEEFNTDMEKCVIKCNWEANREQREAEEKKAMEEVSEEIKSQGEANDNQN